MGAPHPNPPLQPPTPPCPKYGGRDPQPPRIDAPALWNKLQPALCQISYTSYELTKISPLAISPQVFHPKLKTQLFHKSYPNSSFSFTSLTIPTLYTPTVAVSLSA